LCIIIIYLDLEVKVRFFFIKKSRLKLIFWYDQMHHEKLYNYIL